MERLKVLPIIMSFVMIGIRIKKSTSKEKINIKRKESINYGKSWKRYDCNLVWLWFGSY